MPEETAPAVSSDKDFADFLGKLIEGKAEEVSGDLKFFASKLTEQRDQHQELSKNIQQAESQLAQLRSQTIKLEGSIEQGVSAVRHFWERDQSQNTTAPLPK